MPNTESAKRAHRKAEKRRLRNRSQRSALKTMIKKVRSACEAGQLAEATAALAVIVKRLDQSADKHLIHKNKAARLKSRLTLLVNKSAPAASQPAS
jgi:small subunit ribosomal protein S20